VGQTLSKSRKVILDEKLVQTWRGSGEDRLHFATYHRHLSIFSLYLSFALNTHSHAHTHIKRQAKRNYDFVSKLSACRQN